jgi:hypothetical protein
LEGTDTSLEEYVSSHEGVVIKNRKNGHSIVSHFLSCLVIIPTGSFAIMMLSAIGTSPEAKSKEPPDLGLSVS